jgi:ABC-2 type transport system ATP-binding protein
MLLNIIKPDSGTVAFSLNGSEVAQAANLGYLPEDRGLYKDIPIIKTLTYMGVLRGLARPDAAARARTWLDKVGLGDRAHDKLDTLSKGNQQKVQFVSSILHSPEFAILDEPFSGLDPLNQEFFLEIIRDLRRQGTTILLCAHQMALVERLADRVLLMNRGREVLSGTLPEIRKRAKTSNKAIIALARAAEIESVRASAVVERIENLDTGEFACYLKPGVSLQEFLQQIAAIEILDIHTARIDLHEIFVQTVGLSNLSSGEGAES